ncbi:hypothetical protein [Carboxylicivirga taeanensis]|uniref:hypothetical protein n=1 Tax=Carboxylicivirga taeanensis TaxID=1416875 RepID=UPI003F6E3058
MLESCKIVLNGVKEDKQLFKKELIKSLAWLSTEEQKEFSQWVKDNFYRQHADIIDEIILNKYDYAS